MKFKLGRENFALTIYTPTDCTNSCKFCVSKSEYKNCNNAVAVLDDFYHMINASPLIKDVVITGGEPMEDIAFIEKMCKLLKDKNVYINTSLTIKNFVPFVTLVNRTKCIKGVNISRHADSFEHESFDNIVQDDFIQLIEKPVKINCVLIDAPYNVEYIKRIIDRWAPYKHATLCFREDFRKTTAASLHILEHPFPFVIMKKLGAEFIDHTFCDVCDTIKFDLNDAPVMFHRGLQESSFKVCNTTVVNDFIIFPDGHMAYDWDRLDTDIEDLKNMIKQSVPTTILQRIGNGKIVERQAEAHPTPTPRTSGYSCGHTSNLRLHCGRGSC